MWKLSSDFSGRARAENSRWVLALILLGVAGLGPSQTVCAAEVAPVAPQTRNDFLSLPTVDAEVEAPPKALKVGDTIHLRAGFSAPEGEIKIAETDLSDQGWALKAEGVGFTVVPLKPGKLTLPSLAIQQNGKNVARTNPKSFDVESAIEKGDSKPNEPAAFQPPVGLVFPLWIVVLLSVLTIVLLSVLVYLIYRWWKSRKPKVVAIPQVVLTEDERALKKFEDLEKQELIQKGLFKSYYFSVSEILKEYIGARYRIDALESTTREMKELLEGEKAVEEKLMSQLVLVFDRLDLVKFTDAVPSSDEPAKILSEAREFVLSTRRLKSPEVISHAAQ